MSTTDVNAPKGRRTNIGSFLAPVLDRIRSARARWAEERRKLVLARAAHHAAVLSAMTDDQLDGWGLKREDIMAHAYKNVRD
ncbi:MAG: hypothetical protein AAF557_04095 [Pseudomonadota bacterium]